MIINLILTLTLTMTLPTLDTAGGLLTGPVIGVVYTAPDGVYLAGGDGLPGERLAVVLPAGIDFGCFYAVAVLPPIDPPRVSEPSNTVCKSQPPNSPEPPEAVTLD